ncbi:MAG TPA: hypothetical protein VIN73_11225 [Vicingaceae bacterium]
MNKEQIFDLSKSIMIAVVSALAVVVFQQLFFKSNMDYELRKDIIKENYEYYVAIENFCDIGYHTVMTFEEVASQPKINVYIDSQTNETVKIDTTTEYSTASIKSIELPTIAVDTAKQKKWILERDLIIKNKNKVDHLYYIGFLDLIRLVEKNPWPKSLDIESLKNSVWSNKEFIEKWELRNMLLWSEADEYIRIN